MWPTAIPDFNANLIIISLHHYKCSAIFSTAKKQGSAGVAFSFSLFFSTLSIEGNTGRMWWIHAAGLLVLTWCLGTKGAWVTGTIAPEQVCAQWSTDEVFL